MKGWLVVALALLSFGSKVPAQMADQDVMKAEQAKLDARRKGDSAAHASLIADDFAQVATNGQMQDKKYATTRPAAAKLDARDQKVQVFGDVAIVTGTQSGLGATAQDSRFTHVWQRQGGRWVNVLVQATPVLAPPAPPAAAAAAPPAPPPTSWPEGKTQDERDVIKVQRALNDTFAKKDAAAYGQHTADNFIRIMPNGALVTRAEFLKGVAATPEVKRVESNNTEFRFRAYGPIALLTYLDKSAGAPIGNRMTRIFVKQGGSWKQLLTQSTPVAAQ
jgi:ketosteroid isomerase-like protein